MRTVLRSDQTPTGVEIAQDGWRMFALSSCCRANIHWATRGWRCSACFTPTVHSSGMKSGASISDINNGGLIEWVADWTGLSEECIEIGYKDEVV